MGGQFPYQTIKNIDVKNSTILLRADYNVPLDDNGNITDNLRIIASLPTIKYLSKNGAKVVIISHLGRPKGKADQKYSLRPVANALQDCLNQPIILASDCIGESVLNLTRQMKSGDIVMLENLRFHKEEEQNDLNFAKELAESSNADIFVQDGFGVVHRPHASTAAITKCLPAVAGLLLEKEYLALTNAIKNPRRPLTTVIGGAKINDKISLIKKFIDIADNVIIGGALANNFLKHLGYNVSDSLVDNESDQTVAEIMLQAKRRYGNDMARHFILPIDVAIAKSGSLSDQRTEVKLSSLSAINPQAKIYDIGHETSDLIDFVIESSRTVIWNGTLGMSEYNNFAHGSARLALSILKSKSRPASIIGGGDTADFVRHWDSQKGNSFSHISTGGGASLEFLSGIKLPGIVSLRLKDKQL